LTFDPTRQTFQRLSSSFWVDIWLRMPSPVVHVDQPWNFWYATNYDAFGIAVRDLLGLWT